MSLLKKYLSRINLENSTVRLFTAVFAVCFISVISDTEHAFYEEGFFTSFDLLTYCLGICGIFAVLTVLFSLFESPRTEKLLLLCSYMCYALVTVMEFDDAYNDIWYETGACLVLLAICFYVFKPGDKLSQPDGEGKRSVFDAELPKGAAISIIACVAVFAGGFIAVQTVCRYLTQSTPCYDFGIFSQMFYSMRKTLEMTTTCERTMELSHLAVHVSPIYYLFLPIYTIFPSPATLQVCQALMLASGVIPVVLICRRLKLSWKATVVFAAIYCLYPALSGGCYYDLHENKFLAPLLLWLFYFIERDKWWGVLTFSVLTLLVKEDAAVYIAFAGLYLLLSRRARLKGTAILALSVSYFALVVFMLEKYGQGVMSYRYDNFLFGEDKGLTDVIINVIQNPAYVISELFDSTTGNENDPTKLKFLLQMLLPVGFLPFITRKYSRFILLCPLILINLMPDYIYQHNIYFQYTYGTLAFIIYAALMNYSELSDRFKKTAGAFALCACVLLYTRTVTNRSDYLKNYLASRESHDEVRQALTEIPESASVSATTFFVATCSQRDVLYDMQTSAFEKSDIVTEYVALDLRYSAGRELNKEYKDNEDYEQIYYLQSWCAIYHCVNESIINEYPSGK